MTKRIITLLFLSFSLLACGEKPRAEISPPDDQQPNSPVVVGEVTALPTAKSVTGEAPPAAITVSDPETGPGLTNLLTAKLGDLDRMEQSRFIRVLTVLGPGHYYLDGAVEKGLTYEFFKLFEKHLNQHLGKGHLKLHIAFIPVARDELIPALIAGRGDIAAAGLTITPEREAVIDFTHPASNELSEILVTGPTAPQLNSIEDLAGQLVYVRASSSYYASLEKLNSQLLAAGKPAVRLKDASETLEDEDLLEMVNAGLLDWTVVDDYKAHVWEDLFENIVVRDDLVFREGGRIAFAVRQDSPELKQILNEFLKTHRQGTLTGNVLFNRHFRDHDWAGSALDTAAYKRFQELVEIFSNYGEQYGVDYLMVAAQGYQESRLNQKARSKAGAIGIMQMLPSTASDKNVGIADISTADANIHAGVKYLSFLRQRYFSDPGLDKYNRALFSFAAYNAGPARIARLRSKAAKAGYDPNVWFDNVEIFAAREIGRETVQYVANIMKYYIAYRLTLEQQASRQSTKEALDSD